MTIGIALSRFETSGDSIPTWIVFDHIGKAYTPAGGEKVLALTDVSFDIRQGEIFGIIGRSGAGKSSLIRLINGLERPTSGRIMVGGTDVAALSGQDLTALRRQTGMIFQGFNLLSSKSVVDNVALPLRLAGVRGAQAQARAMEALDLVGLTTKAKSYQSQLSGGQKQRAGIARAIVQKPKLLLSDEATSALDPETTQSILSLLADINRRLGLTIVLITHEMDVIRQIADRVGVLDRGHLVETGPVWKVFGSPKHPVTQALLGRGSAETRDGRLCQPNEVLYHVDLSGPGFGDPDLFAIVSAIGPGARLVRGGLERIGGRPSGRLVIAAPKGAPGQTEVVLARLRAVSPNAEIESTGTVAHA